MLDFSFFLDGREQSVVAAALGAVELVSPEQARLLRADLERLAHAAETVQKSPSLGGSSRLRRRSATSEEALIEALCKVADHDLDLQIPTKAVLGQAYLVAKINFFKALGYALTLVPEAGDLGERVDFEVGQSIYSKLGEELFVAIVTDASGDHEVKLQAARALSKIWDERLLTEIDDFAPALEAVWEARDRVRPVLGTMIGTHEICSLLRATRDERFVDYFGGDDVPLEQVQAFEEFLFGLSHEEIGRLRTHLLDQHAPVVSPEEARTLLGHRPESWAPAAGGPQALYSSYKRRKVKARYRALTGAAGPKKTAEEYVMIELLRGAG